MATKLGNGGYSQENYDPATGRYVEDGKENSSYDNPNEIIKLNSFSTKSFQQTKNILYNIAGIDIDDLDLEQDLDLEEDDRDSAFYKLLNERRAASNSNDYIYKDSTREELIELCWIDERVIAGTILTKNGFYKMTNYGDEDVCKTTLSLFRADGFRISGYDKNVKQTAYSLLFNKVYFGRKDISNPLTSIQTDGASFYHEAWHAIDSNYGSNGKELSCGYICKNGKTLEEVFLEETKTLPVDDIIKEYQDEAKNHKIANKDKIEELKRIEDDLSKKYKEAQQKYGEFSDEAEKASKKYYKALTDRTEFEYTPCFAYKKYSDITDVIDGIVDGSKQLFCGHSQTKGYWKRSHIRVKEFFAEIASAKAANKESYELLKKYLPKSVEAFNEIYENLSNGTIKYGK